MALIANLDHPGMHLERASSESMGRQLGLPVIFLPTRTLVELNEAFRSLAAIPPQAVYIFADGFALQNGQRIIDAAMGLRLPVISGWSSFAQSGALCTYGPRLTKNYKRLAYYIDRVIKGANPADLPIEQPTTFELIVNLKTAKALDLTIDPVVLARADEVIE